MLRKCFKRKWVVITACLFLFVFLLAGAYVLSTRYIKYFGVNLTPTRDFPIHSITYYLQADPGWGADFIGGSQHTMSSSGCLVSSVAGAMGELGVEITPKELNERLTAVDGYQNADLIWYKLEEAVPGVTYRYSRLFTAQTIDRDLEQGLTPIVKVYYKGSLFQHWVVILGAQDGEYLIYDPFNSELEPVPLSMHGKVYAYRVLELTNRQAPW